MSLESSIGDNTRLRKGAGVTWLLILCTLLAVGYLWLLLPASEPSLRFMIRSSGRTSMLIFALAFATAPLYRISRNPTTRWMRRNRRSIGLLFAWSQLLHLFGLLALALWYPDPFLAGLGILTLAGGGLAYFFTFAMAATSNDWAVTALGPVRWRRFHLIGAWWIWVVLAQTATLASWPVVAPLLAAALLRLQAAWSARQVA